MAIKNCRVHKNQAVNLLQIPIHGCTRHFINAGSFPYFIKSRVASGSGENRRYNDPKNFNQGIAAKFLQSAYRLHLQEGNGAAKNNAPSPFYPAGFKRLC